MLNELPQERAHAILQSMYNRGFDAVIRTPNIFDDITDPRFNTMITQYLAVTHNIRDYLQARDLDEITEPVKILQDTYYALEDELDLSIRKMNAEILIKNLNELSLDKFEDLTVTDKDRIEVLRKDAFKYYIKNIKLGV